MLPKEHFSYAHFMKPDEFIKTCESRAFIDYDGFGYPVYNNMVDESEIIYPSFIYKGKLKKFKEGVTEIVWFNR